MTDQVNDAAWWKDEQVRRDAEIASLKKMLRLANDKMAEQVRQALHAVAEEALGQRSRIEMERFLVKVRDANAPKD